MLEPQRQPPTFAASGTVRRDAEREHALTQSRSQAIACVCVFDLYVQGVCGGCQAKVWVWVAAGATASVFRADPRAISFTRLPSLHDHAWLLHCVRQRLAIGAKSSLVRLLKSKESVSFAWYSEALVILVMVLCVAFSVR